MYVWIIWCSFLEVRMLKKRSLHTVHEDSSDLCFFTVIIKYVHCVGRKCELAQTFSSIILYNVNDVRRIFHEKCVASQHSNSINFTFYARKDLPPGLTTQVLLSFVIRKLAPTRISAAFRHRRSSRTPKPYSYTSNVRFAAENTRFATRTRVLGVCRTACTSPLTLYQARIIHEQSASHWLACLFLSTSILRRFIKLWYVSKYFNTSMVKIKFLWQK